MYMYVRHQFPTHSPQPRQPDQTQASLPTLQCLSSAGVSAHLLQLEEKLPYAPSKPHTLVHYVREPCTVPSPPPHRMVLRAGPRPYSYDNGTQHIAWRATGIHPRPAASNEWTNECSSHTPLADNPENLRSRQSHPSLLKKI